MHNDVLVRKLEPKGYRKRDQARPIRYTGLNAEAKHSHDRMTAKEIDIFWYRCLHIIFRYRRLLDQPRQIPGFRCARNLVSHFTNAFELQEVH